MNIAIICIGKLKEKYWTQAVEEYSKRLRGYCSLEVVELKESRLPDKAGAAEELAVKEAEGREILKRIKDNMYFFRKAGRKDRTAGSFRRQQYRFCHRRQSGSFRRSQQTSRF